MSFGISRTPRPSSFYSKASVPPEFQEFMGNQFGQGDESQGSQIVGHQEKGSVRQSKYP